MNSIAISTDNLTCDFKTVRALDKLSLEVSSGIVYGFLGPNGAGKTTTIRLLLGILAATDGSGRVLGYDIRSQSDRIRAGAGSLLEHNGLYDRLSPEENLEFYGRVWHIPTHERRSRIRELLTRIDLWDRRHDRVRTLSRGMKQKLAVSRAILHRPPLLFLDEPTAGLDPVAAAALRDDLAHLVRHEGMTVFLTTHNLTEAEKLCSMVGVISAGKLLTVGHPDELKAQAGKMRVEVTGSGFTEQALARIRDCQDVESAHTAGSLLGITLVKDVSTAPLIRLMVGEGIEIEEVRRGSASLEEAFLKLIEEKNDD
ncbi:ATP-binding cassette domain-containing protein [Candidatus Latescibacterota bacterium]